MVMLPLRAAPVLACTEYVTVALPVPLVGLTLIQELLFEAVQPHVLADALTVKLPALAVAGTLALVGLREKEHVGAGGVDTLLAIVYWPKLVTVPISE